MGETYHKKKIIKEDNKKKDTRKKLQKDINVEFYGDFHLVNRVVDKQRCIFTITFGIDLYERIVLMLGKLNCMQTILGIGKIQPRFVSIVFQQEQVHQQPFLLASSFSLPLYHLPDH